MSFSKITIFDDVVYLKKTFLCNIILNIRLMEEGKDIRMLLVDDHELVLQGLKHIIECSLTEVKNVCTASSGREAISLITSQHFHLYVLDLELPDMSGLDVIACIHENDSDARIIVNTMHEEVWCIKELMQRQVDGILFKSVYTGEMLEAIRCVLRGETYYCEQARRARAGIANGDEQRHDALTPRELDVLKLLSDGKTTQEIAAEMCLSTNTVDTHRRHLLEKLNARNVADLLMIATAYGIIPLRKVDASSLRVFKSGRKK